MPGAHSFHRTRSATPSAASSAFMRPVQRTSPKKFNHDIDEELLHIASTQSMLQSITRKQHTSTSGARDRQRKTQFATITENKAAAAQWQNNAVARARHEKEKMYRYLHSFVPTGQTHPSAQQFNKNSNINNMSAATSSSRPASTEPSSFSSASSSPAPAPTTSLHGGDVGFRHDISVFEDKLARLRQEAREREEEQSKIAPGCGGVGGGKRHAGSVHLTAGAGAGAGAGAAGAKHIGTSSSAAVVNSNNNISSNNSKSNCAPFALPKVLQMLFRLLLSRKLSATKALRDVGFPELRSRLTGAAEGGMVKRHAFEAIFLDCLRTDQERLEHAAVVDCFLLDAGGDAELAFVLIALQVLLGIASAADVMRYCFYLLDTSSRVPRYLTRLELEALLREADAAAAANPASKDDAEYQSMRGAVLHILDPACALFDGKGRMPLSGFLEKLRSAMSDQSHEPVAATLQLAAADKQSANRKKRQQAHQQQLDGLATATDLFHHSTSRRIVLQTAPEELVKET